jgi:tetratricopeptide (TPR) repeat protein
MNWRFWSLIFIIFITIVNLGVGNDANKVNEPSPSAYGGSVIQAQSPSAYGGSVIQAQSPSAYGSSVIQAPQAGYYNSELDMANAEKWESFGDFIFEAIRAVAEAKGKVVTFSSSDIPGNPTLGDNIKDLYLKWNAKYRCGSNAPDLSTIRSENARSTVPIIPPSCEDKTDLGGVNFTSIKLNYIAVSTDQEGSVNFDLILKAQKAEGASPIIDPMNSSLIGATAFLTGLAVPDDKFWVNLAPWEPDRIIDTQLSQSDIGRIMLEADFQMKKDFSNYENPCANETGKALWDLLDKKGDVLVQECMKMYPGEIEDIDNIEFHPITRHWIVPDKIYAYTNGTQIYIINASLTINSEPVSDHSSFQVKNQDMGTLSNACLEKLNNSAKEYGEYLKEIEDRMIQPYVIADVNYGEKYENLRDAYVALALAQWYKSSVTSHMDIFRESLDSSNSTVLKSTKPWSPDEIWNNYVYSFKNGEYRCWDNTTTKTATKTTTKSILRPGGGVDFASIRNYLIEINGIPSGVQDRIEKSILDGFIIEEKDILFGKRFHFDPGQNNSVSGSESLTNAVRLDPNLALDWYNKGIALQDQGKLDEAVEAYDEAIRLDPKLVLAWTNKGAALDAQGKYDEAVGAYDEAIRLDPNHANAWNNKGTALGKQGKYDEAIKAYDAAIKLDPNYADARNNKGEILKVIGDPNLALDWYNKGTALQDQGKFDEAVEAYDEAIRLDPKLALAWTNKGAALDAQGKLDKAVEAYDEAIRLDPNKANSWNNKGTSLSKQGKYNEAVEAYNEAIRLDPNYAVAWNNKGEILKALGRTNEADVAYAKAKELGYGG